MEFSFQDQIWGCLVSAPLVCARTHHPYASRDYISWLQSSINILHPVPECPDVGPGSTSDPSRVRAVCQVPALMETSLRSGRVIWRRRFWKILGGAAPGGSPLLPHIPASGSQPLMLLGPAWLCLLLSRDPSSSLLLKFWIIKLSWMFAVWLWVCWSCGICVVLKS